MPKGPTKYIVIAFLCLLLLGFCREGQAESVVSAEAGATVLSGQFSKGFQVLITETWNKKYSLGIGYIYKQEVIDRQGDFYELQENLYVHAQRYVQIVPGHIWLGFGPAYFNNTNRALGKNFSAALSAHFAPNDRFSFVFRHYSNAGSGTPNMGQDAIMIGWNF